MKYNSEKIYECLTSIIDEQYETISNAIYITERIKTLTLFSEKPEYIIEGNYLFRNKESFEMIKESVKKYFDEESKSINSEISDFKSDILFKNRSLTVVDNIVKNYIEIIKKYGRMEYKKLQICTKYQEVVKKDCLDFYVSKEEFKNIIIIIENIDLSLIEQFSAIIYFIEKILETNKSYDKDTTEFELYLNKIKEHYIDKSDSYDENDVRIIVENLKKLGFDSKICDQIGIRLLKKIDKKVMNINIDFDAKKIDYKEIIKELNTYFDFRTMCITKLLSIDEIIRVVSLLQKINTDESEIRKFLDDAYIQINKLNPIAKYIQLREKLKYYEDKYAIKEDIKVLDDYFSSLIMCDEYEYDFFKQCIDEDLKRVLSYFPKSYEYEMNVARSK